MGLLSRLKAILGLTDGRTEPQRRDNVDVTIERTPSEDVAERERSDAETEAAVKGVEETEPPTAEKETTDEAEPEAEIEETDEDEASEESDAAEAEVEEPLIEEAEAGEPEIEAEPEVEEPEVEEEPEEPEPADEEAEADETAEAEKPGDGVALEEIKGVGPAYAERLRDAGIDDVGDLSEADAEALAEETDLSAKRIGRWIERARGY